MKKKILTKWYQFKADLIISLMETAPDRVVPILFYMGLDLNETAILKNIWLN